MFVLGSSWRGGSEYVEYTSYNEYYGNCTVTENNGVVTLTYNSSDAVGINLDKFALDSGKTYVFVFGSSAGKAKITSNGSSYSNVRISISSRNTPYDLILSSVSFENSNTVISSSAPVLNLGFYGSSCSVKTKKGATGSTGNSYYFPELPNGGLDGGRGKDGNVAVVCSGTLNITCGTITAIKGGDGGDGGSGGKNNTFGGTGGNGGAGANGAVAIKADVINVYFANGKTRSDITVKGGSGGSGGAKGTGWSGNGSSGSSGSSALASNVTINYIE